jgi:hypothetical protein
MAVLHPNNTTTYIPLDVDGFYDERAVTQDGRILMHTYRRIGTTFDTTNLITIVNPDNSVDEVELGRLIDWMEVGPDGYAYVLSESNVGGTHMTNVHIINPDNSVNVVSVPGYQHTPTAISSNGHFLVLVTSFEGGVSRNVLVFNPDGTYTAVPITGEATGGVAVDSDGRAYVTVYVEQGGQFTYKHHEISIADPPPTIV